MNRIMPRLLALAMLMALTLAALLYLAITLPLTRLVAWMESKQKRSR